MRAAISRWGCALAMGVLALLVYELSGASHAVAFLGVGVGLAMYDVEHESEGSR